MSEAPTVVAEFDPPLKTDAEQFAETRATIERLRVENIQMKFALGYPMPADLERYIIPSNPFRCGTCAARNINSLEATIERLRAEVERLTDAANHSEAMALGEAVDNARLTAENERLRAALDGLVKHESSIMTDVLSAHRNRGNGASQWMSEDDADFRRDLRQAFETARAAPKETGR